MKKFYLLSLFSILFSSGLLAQMGNTITFEDDFDNEVLTCTFDGEVNGRNSYSSNVGGDLDVRVAWSGSRWEIIAIQNDVILHFSNYDTAPNPPDLATGNWQKAFDDNLLQFSGSGTQAVQLAFTLSPDVVCENGGVQMNLGGGTPTGGIYSGAGVTDNGNGTTFTFDPMMAGTGNITINYGDPANTVMDMITVSPTPIASIDVNNTITCNGGADGSLTASGGTAYQWSVGATTNTITNLSAGIYTVTVTNAEGCESTASAELTEPSAITVVLDVTSPLCFGNSNGSAMATPTGGTPPYTYAWSDGQTTPTAVNLSAGFIEVTVTDANGCIATSSSTITQPTQLAVSLSSTQDTGISDGTATAAATGGTSPYTYSWSNGATGNFIFGLTGGDYTVTVTDANGCEVSQTVTVEAPVAVTLELSVESVCLSEGSQTNLTGGMPIGGVYSGAGVTDNGDGATFSLAPSMSGTVEVTYTLNGQSATDNLTVFDDTFSFEASSVGLQLNLTNITYGSAITSATIDYGDGMTMTLDVEQPSLSYDYNFGGTYTFCITVEGNDCSNTQCAMITLTPLLPGDVCSDAMPIDSLFNRPQNTPYTSTLLTNVGYTTDDSDPNFGYECFGEPDGNGSDPSLERTRWFTFVGDGNLYYITTVECNATDYIDFGDTQIAIYTGECDALVASACNEDGPDAMPGGPFPAGLEFQTAEGVEYRMMIDGFGPDFEADGEFCIQVTNLSVTSVGDIFGTPYQVFPNPTKGALNITGITPDVVRIQDSYGKLIRTVQNNTNEFSIDDLPNGVYFIQVGLDGSWSTSRIVKTN